MRLIKLNAIDSTNDFLKGLSNNQLVENLTVVTAENQTKGKGQMGSVWNSEPSKNLIMSVLINEFVTDINRIFDMNIVFSVSIIEVLEDLRIPELSIKWPNDILSYTNKIGGILIENSIKSDGTINSILGLGLNVNQINFENLPKASSLAVICNTVFDKEEILLKIIKKLEHNIQTWTENSDLIWSKYTHKLFKRGVPMPFQDQNNQNFMGIIQGVSPTGKLQILLSNDSVAEFGIKEIRMLY